MTGAKPVLVHQMTEDDTPSDDFGYEPIRRSHCIYKWIVPWTKE
jgi:hypothetical protein